MKNQGMLPFEFTIEGPPVSSQTNNKKRLNSWKKKVAKVANESIENNVEPVSDEVTFRVTYYYENEYPDVDNIIKPIQDALVGLVYIDDNQVVETSSRRRYINGAYKIRGASPLIVQGLIKGIDFLHIKVALFEPNEELD